MKPAQNVHFSQRNPGVQPQILSTRDKKKRNKMKKEETFFKGKQKENKGIKHAKGKTKGKKEKHGKKLKKKTKMKK